MAIYKHGTYGEYAESVGHVNVQSGTVAVYVGTAPINLVRGYEKYVNTPVGLTDFNAVKNRMGYSDDWSKFTLCEAFKMHLNNEDGNVGPIVAINVLNPAVHKKSSDTTSSLTFINGRASFASDTIILDTLVLAELVEGEDFEISYDYNKGLVIINSIGEDEIAGSVAVTYSEIDASLVTAEDVIGDATDAGVYTGFGCIELVYNKLGIIPNIVAAPGWSERPEVYKAMLKASSKINNHWDAMVYADIPLTANGSKVDTIPLAIKWKDENGYNNAFSKVFYPQNTIGGKNYHISVIATWETMLVDAMHGGIPMESPSNKAIPASAHYFGEGSTNKGFDQSRANELNANGITTTVFWGGIWVLWGPHTAAYKHGVDMDNRDIFDNSIRMMMHASNSFQQEHALAIDGPMTRAMADTIRNREQEKADALAAIGAYIGTPVVEFRESDNSEGDLVEGNFVWYTKSTPTPPFKSGTLRVAYTTEGFTTYFERGDE